MSQPYPLLLQPILKEKVWGGRRLEAFGKALAPGIRVGESWEVADLASTSASGGGGSPEHSRILNGPLEGRTLHHALTAWGRSLLGDHTPVSGGFPLLVKYLDAREHLSIQVHPSPAYLRAHPDQAAHLKTESWYILDAAPGSVIYKGLKPGVTRESFAAHVQDKSVVDDLVAIPAVVGECHNLPSGVIHALGAGVLVAEVQTPSDTTFRVYDWEKELGRTGRELHLAQALECLSFAPEDAPPPAAKLPPELTQGRLVTTEYFAIDEARGVKGDVIAAGTGPGCSILMLLSGRAFLVSGANEFEPMPLAAGMTVVVPAAIASKCFLRVTTPAKALRITVGKP